MIKCLFGAAFLMFSTIAAEAQQSFEFSGEDSIDGEGATGQGANVNFYWRAEFKIGSLLGEPVVSTRFAYDLEAGTITLPSSSARGKPAFETHFLSSLPQEAIAKVRLYDLRMRIDFEGVSNDFFIESDVGQPGPTGEWSFNVPSSPDWGKLFQYRRSIEGNRRYLPADIAKKEYLSGLEPSGAYIVSGHVTLWDLHEWYESLHPLKTLNAYGAAIDQLEEGLHLSYGYPRSVLDSSAITTLYAGTVKEQLALIEQHEERLEKLLKVPDFYKRGDNHRPYEMAVDQAHNIRMAMSDYDQRIESGSDQEILLEYTGQGRAPQFDDSVPSLISDSSRTSLQTSKDATYQVADTNEQVVGRCRIRIFLHCEGPYSSEVPKWTVFKRHLDGFPTDICDDGYNSFSYDFGTETVRYPLSFPMQNRDELEVLLKSFVQGVRNRHPNCGIVSWRTATLQIIPPDPIYVEQKCTDEPQPTAHSSHSSYVCADF